MITGGCLCGRVTYEYGGSIDQVSMCHCIQCQKAQGGAFAPVCPVEDELFTLRGREFIREHTSSEGKVRAFCSECGSPLYSAKADAPGIKRLRLGTLDTAVYPTDRYHKFVGSKASWFEITDDLPRFKGNRS